MRTSKINEHAEDMPAKSAGISVVIKKKHNESTYYSSLKNIGIG